MVEALTACEPDMLQVSNMSTQETDQRVLEQLSDLYDRELVGIIGNYQPRNCMLMVMFEIFLCLVLNPFSFVQMLNPFFLQAGPNRSQGSPI